MRGRNKDREKQEERERERGNDERDGEEWDKMNPADFCS